MILIRSSKIYIVFKGKELTSKEVLLSANGFKKGSFIRKSVFADDVGNLQGLTVSQLII
jgi:hypothetical protein